MKLLKTKTIDLRNIESETYNHAAESKWHN